MLASEPDELHPKVLINIALFASAQVAAASAIFRVLLPGIVLHFESLSLTHMHLQVGIANQRHPLYSSESSQHISIKIQE
jgi:hypothetical protein